MYAYFNSHPEYSGLLKFGFHQKIRINKEFMLSIQSLIRGKKHTPLI